MSTETKEVQPEELLLKMATESGELTEVTENVRRHAEKIDPRKELAGADLVLAVCDYVSNLIPSEEELAGFYRNYPQLVFDKRLRSADQLLDKGNILPGHSQIRNISGCIETAHIVRAILLAKGIPCVYTETLEEDWCKNEAPSFEIGNPSIPPMRGHVFIDVYLEDEAKWITVDTSGDDKIHEYGDYMKFGKKYIYPGFAKDSWDLGYKSMREFQERVVGFFQTS